MPVVTPEPQNSTGNNHTPKRKSGVVVPHKTRWHQWFAATLIYLCIRARFYHEGCAGPLDGLQGKKGANDA